MIFCLEDDESIRQLMLYTLKSASFDAMGFEDEEDFFDALSRHKPDLIMLDIMLKRSSGLDILKKLKKNENTKGIPVIMATAKSTEYDKVIGLDLGADDYLAKPFGMMEMISRIKAVLRRTSTQSEQTLFKLGALKLDLTTHSVTTGDKKIELTVKEFELLHLLMKNPKKVFTRENLLSSVWDSDFLGETRTVDVHIATLRTKLDKYKKYIKTIRGVGYTIEE